MLLRIDRQGSDLVLMFGLILANITTILFVVWLIPQVVLIVLILWLILIIFTVWILNKHNLIDKFLGSLRRKWFIFPFLIFSGLSIFWSVYPEISLFRWLILVCTIITGGYMGLQYDMRELIRKLSIFGIAVLFLSSLLVFFVPQLGVMNYHSIQGAWKGVFWHKNHMGLIATFINILFLIQLIDSFQSKAKSIFLWVALYIFSLLFVYQSDSVAAYLTTIILHGVVLLVLILLKFREKIRGSHYLLIVAVLFLASPILFDNLDHVFGVFNRNTTLTGRIPMWTHLYDAYISERPLLGYGFNAFWYIHAHRLVMQQATGYPDPIVIADNGFIDLVVNIGYLGFIMFLLFYFGVWWHSIKYALKSKDISGFFPVILLSYTLLANISWSLIFENESFFMLIMIAVLFCISNSRSRNGGDM